VPVLTNVNETPDSALMEEVRQGDLASLAILFERHHRALFNFFMHVNGSRDVSEDLVQDVFFRILKYKKSYRPDRSFTAWMYQIARNAQIDSVQKHRNEVSIGDYDFGSGGNMDDSLRQKQELVLLRRAMARLPVEKRELLVLSRFQNMKYEEIAAILGCDIGAVKVRVYRAVRASGPDLSRAGRGEGIMNCEEARKHFVDYWSGALDDMSNARFQGHLAICDGCRREAEDLKQVWSTLGSLPDQDPGTQMRLRFYDSLREWKQREVERQSRFWWSRHPAFQVAFAMAILVIGVVIGSVITRQSGEVAHLRGEIFNMRQLVTLSLLQQQSAGDRLQGVNWSYRVEQPDTEVLAALLTTANHDPNVNVRLAAVDALRNFSDSPVARRGLVQALGKQTSPLVQIAVLDQLVEARERSAVAPIKVLLASADLNPDVKQRAEWAIRKLQ